MSDNSREEKQRSGRDARRSRGVKRERQKEGAKDEEGRARCCVLKGKNK